MSFESMSVENMKKYMGTNPRPTDFDRYWEESLEEIAAWDPSPRLVPAGFSGRPGPNVLTSITAERMARRYMPSICGLPDEKVRFR